MYSSKGFVAGACLLVGLSASALAEPASAQQKPAGLSIPAQSANISKAPGWSVHSFVTSDGIRYIQIADRSETVRCAVATAGNEILSLPLGSDESRVSTPRHPRADVAPAEIVYSDHTLTITAATDASGKSAWIVSLAHLKASDSLQATDAAASQGTSEGGTGGRAN